MTRTAQGEKNVVSNKQVEASPSLSSPDARKLATNTVVQSMYALCISSDDPRLGKSEVGA